MLWCILTWSDIFILFHHNHIGNQVYFCISYVSRCNLVPQMLVFVFTYSRMYTGKKKKYWVGEKGFGLFWVQLGIDFFQGQCAIMELCYSLWLPVQWQNAHTRKPHTRMHVARQCENATSQHQQNIQKEDQSEETLDAPVQVILVCAVFCPFFFFFFFSWPSSCAPCTLD